MGKILVWNHDNAGNLLTANGNTYTYGNSSWVDLLTAFNGHSITYDAGGNPLTYYNGTNWSFTWEGSRRLTGARSSAHTISYTYDLNGLRTSKTVDGELHTYYYAGGRLLREVYGNTILDFAYDASGNPFSLTYNGTKYYYVTNLQGDVFYLVDTTGTVVASYTYDPYGKILTVSGSMAEINPLRYRGYYYDTDSGFYYLQSRYFDPTICRFINADVYASTGQGFIGCNMFTYCVSNPIRSADKSGQSGLMDKWNDFWEGVRSWLEEQKEDDSDNADVTATVGFTASAGFGLSGSESLGFTFDTKGNFGFCGTYSGGGGFPSAAVGGFVSINNAPDIYAQRGMGFVTGLSGGALIGVGGEYNMLIDAEKDCTYNGGTFTASVGLYPTVVEVHGEVSYSAVVGFNVYDLLITFANWMITE